MTTAVTMLWQTQFRINSITDQTVYSIDHVIDTPPDALKNLETNLRMLKYIDIKTRLKITFP